MKFQMNQAGVEKKQCNVLICCDNDVFFHQIYVESFFHHFNLSIKWHYAFGIKWMKLVIYMRVIFKEYSRKLHSKHSKDNSTNLQWLRSIVESHLSQKLKIAHNDHSELKPLLCLAFWEGF